MTRARSPEPEFIPCSPPPDHGIDPMELARVAVEHNPANAPPPRAGPQFIAVMTSKYWGPAPRRFGVTFLDNPDQATRKLILAHMNAWSGRTGMSFAEGRSGEVRISRGPGGYWSFLGTDILSIPAGQPTMNLEGFTSRMPESEYKRVVRHETGHCLVGDTLIDCPRDLEKYPLGIPIRDLVGTEPWVYAWVDGKLAIRKASRVWLSKKAAPVVRVTLRTRSGPKHRKYLPPLELVGTPDHPILLSDGVTWKNLGDLEAGDRVCSMYRQANGGRSTLRWTGQPEKVREHVFVCEEVYGPRPEGHDAHHKNERKLDQSSDNLEWKLEHLHHSDHSRGRRDTPETTAKRVAANLGRKHTEEARARMSQAQRGKPPASDETRAKISAVTKGRVQSPETKARRAEAMRRFYESGGKSGMYGKTASEETRAKRSASMKETLRKKREAIVNHVVVSVEPAGVADVYDMTVPGAECFVANGVVVHNSLGCPHEHMRRAIIARIDRNRAVAYFRETAGWPPQVVVEQVLTPVEESSLMGTPSPEDDSIMAYQIPGSITVDGRPVVGGTDITESDFRFLAKLYPPAVAPAPPPPPVRPAPKPKPDPKPAGREFGDDEIAAILMRYFRVTEQIRLGTHELSDAEVVAIVGDYEAAMEQVRRRIAAGGGKPAPKRSSWEDAFT